ncbi:MAG: hypothetical protein Q7T11_07545 [Deltaproteobacteria bacterium]|nr:hypothetical protein [Deltaproteobacteria bacterium]
MIPKRERSRFVSHATELALQMEKLAKMLRSKKHVGTYPEGDPDVMIRKIRRRGRKTKMIK